MSMQRNKSSCFNKTDSFCYPTLVISLGVVWVILQYYFTTHFLNIYYFDELIVMISYAKSILSCCTSTLFLYVVFDNKTESFINKV